MCSDLKKRMDGNLETYDEVITDFENLYLFPAEVIVLDRFRDQWSRFDVLDIGVGVGRTAWVFSQNTSSYEAIDYAPKRIEQCHRLFADAPDRRFSVGDARDLSEYADESFDFILFSYNGIDYIDPEGREAAMAEIKRVLKPGGWFFFSTHSLDVFPFNPPVADKLRGVFSPLGHLLRIRKRLKLKWRNRKVDVREAKERGWACLVDYADSMTTYYIDPARQLELLEAMGYRVDATWDTKGRPLGQGVPDQEWMIHYLVEKSAP